jgi:drug/metabolite transporter (DMT)-like permease
MAAVVGVVLVLGSLVSVATSVVVVRVLWRATRDQWKRTPPERTPRAVAGGAAATIFIGVGIALAIAAPWGPHSFVYLLLAAAGGVMLVVLVGVPMQALRDTRRARRDRPAGGGSLDEE